MDISELCGYLKDNTTTSDYGIYILPERPLWKNIDLTTYFGSNYYFLNSSFSNNNFQKYRMSVPSSVFNTNIIKQYFIDANLIRVFFGYKNLVMNTANIEYLQFTTFCNYNWLPYINLSTPIKIANKDFGKTKTK